MKTVGQILTSARKDLKLTQKDISKKTKIELKYIKAIEADNYQALPSATFGKGFVRNYALAVNKDPDSLVAIFRRDNPSSSSSKKSSPPPPKIRPQRHFSLGPILLLVVGFLIFFSYLSFQYRALIVPPPLKMTLPQKSSVVTSPVTIEGQTSPDSIVTINSDTQVRPQTSGVFTTQINLSPGDHQLDIVSVNRFGRSNQTSIPITVITQ